MKHSAGIIVVKSRQVLLGHPGGPYYRGKEEGVWSMPKGCFDPAEEDALDAAIREFQEETGVDLGLSREKYAAIPLIPGKHKTLYPYVVNYWTLSQGVRAKLDDVNSLKSNTCEILFREELITIPEIDQFRWFDLSVVEYYISPRQIQAINNILEVLG